MSLRELAKTCNVFPIACSQKSIRDQIIKGLVDGDTIEQLLRQQSLTLDTTITMCRAQEAAKNQHKDITNHSVLAIRQSAKPQVRQVPPYTTQIIPKPFPGCGLLAHQGGRAQYPAFKQTCRYCLKVGHFAIGFEMVVNCRRNHQLLEPLQLQKTQNRPGV